VRCAESGDKSNMVAASRGRPGRAVIGQRRRRRRRDVTVAGQDGDDVTRLPVEMADVDDDRKLNPLTPLPAINSHQPAGNFNQSINHSELPCSRLIVNGVLG